MESTGSSDRLMTDYSNFKLDSVDPRWVNCLSIGPGECLDHRVYDIQVSTSQG